MSILWGYRLWGQKAKLGVPVVMYPAKWFTRDYGFMSPTPFAFDGNVEMKAGETMTFRYRVVVFTGDHEAADIAGWREEFEAR